ncbi:MAG: FAD-binding protein [Clostridia bacterium]|nr:FAD-binding protein [Clostridia bacterium]
MIKIDGIRRELSESDYEFEMRFRRTYRIVTDIFYILKQATDARKKQDVHFVCSVLIGAENEEMLLHRIKYAKIFDTTEFSYPELKKEPESRPVIIGSGPAGTFAALTLAHAGAKPIIIERGQAVEERTNTVAAFFKGDTLNENSNVQFGEGGAGTFSDGKLNTGTHSPFIRHILKEYVRFGADEDILRNAKPHIGTDVLKRIAKNIRSEIENLGGTYLFDTQVSDFKMQNGKISAVFAKDWIETDCVILAIGHSARDTFELLHQKGVYMEQKPFSVGVRIEHPQEIINRAQYGSFWNHPALKAADYKLWDDCYTFCMCPGGFVVAAASESGGIVTNGMSYSDRAGENANSALLVNVDARDFGDDLFAGVAYQRKIEQTAYNISQSYHAPAQCISDFYAGNVTKSFSGVKPTYQPGVAECDLNKLLPERITEKLKSGIFNLDKKLKSFAMDDAVLTAPETRSSSPIRIVRDKETLESVSCKGLYPCGEGAGYAGGIMSAAADGIRCALHWIETQS